MGVFRQPWQGCKDQTQAVMPLIERRSGYEWEVGRRLAQGVIMGRMHSGGKGRSGSTRPNVSDLPEWSEQDASRVESLIVELNEQGNSNAMIGTILRDQHSVPSVKLLLGKSVGAVLEEAGKTREVPEELMNMMRKAQSIIDHLENNRKDLHNNRQLNLVESKIRRTAQYYQSNGKLDAEWNYKRDQLRLMVE